MEIKNILFDMGGVLVRFEPERFVRCLDVSEDDRALLLREVYRGAEWVMLDRGSLTEAEFIETVRRRLPERLHAAVETLVLHWEEPPMQVEGMEALVSELAGSGYGLYLLSNAGKRHHEYRARFPALRYFEGRMMISADWRLLKPEAEFYEKAFSLFSLDRRECLFIDDNPGNIEAALRLGLDGLVFFDAVLLRRQLREKGVHI